MACMRAEWVKCGKPSCRSCPHGPYWYAYQWVAGKLKKTYVGKLKTPPGHERVPEEERKADPLDAIFCRSTATEAIARKILGVGPLALEREARSAYCRLTLKHHPDRGGDTTAMARISAAWSYLRSLKGWR